MSSSTSEIIDLIIEEPAVIKVFLNSRNSKNKIKAELHSPKNFDETQKGEPIVQTDPTDNGFTTVVKEKKKAYHLKMVYSYLDPSDTCPLYDLHIAVKSLFDLVDEDLGCE